MEKPSLALEASAAVDECRAHVDSIAVVTHEHADDDAAAAGEREEQQLLRVVTSEQVKLGVRLTRKGWCIVTQSGGDDALLNAAFETMSALLSHCSPAYRAHFATALSDKLSALLGGGSDSFARRPPPDDDDDDDNDDGSVNDKNGDNK